MVSEVPESDIFIINNSNLKQNILALKPKTAKTYQQTATLTLDEKKVSHKEKIRQIIKKPKEKFLTNTKFLQDKMNYLAIRMMMHDHDFQDVIDVGNEIYEEMDNCVLEWVPLLDELSTEAEHWYYNEDWKREWFEKTDGYQRKWGNVNGEKDVFT